MISWPRPQAGRPRPVTASRERFTGRRFQRQTLPTTPKDAIQFAAPNPCRLRNHRCSTRISVESVAGGESATRFGLIESGRNWIRVAGSQADGTVARSRGREPCNGLARSRHSGRFHVRFRVDNRQFKRRLVDSKPCQSQTAVDIGIMDALRRLVLRIGGRNLRQAELQPRRRKKVRLFDGVSSSLTMVGCFPANDGKTVFRRAWDVARKRPPE